MKANSVWTGNIIDKLEWHLGVVDQVDKEGNIVVSYMKRRDKEVYQWLFPEETDVHITFDEQIIARIKVHARPQRL